jgi:hypothetical protein
MSSIVLLCQIVIAIGIVNVWLFRFGRETAWRGGEATSMKEEFQAYGLPLWFMYGIGLLKITFASLLIAGLWVPGLSFYGALGLVALMTGAVAMHLKIRDPLRKALPAISMLAMSTLVATFG